METLGHTRIVGIGGYVPEERVKSDDLMAEIGAETHFGVKENFISDVIGIEERRIASANEKPSDLAVRASEIALADSNISPKEVDLIIFCGIDRDWKEPATAHRVQNLIGAENASCFDVSNACHGFMNGISIADSLIETGNAHTALICTGEKPSNVLFEAVRRLKSRGNSEDFKRWIGALTVGDAGGAMILKRSGDEKGFQKFNFSSNGEHTDLCYYEQDDHGNIEGQMLMKPISKEIVRYHQKMIDKTYQSLHWEADEIDCLMCHQVGARPHKQMASLAKVDIERAPITYKKLGNITSATIPVNFHYNAPKRGDKVLIMGTGSGLSISQTGMIF